MITRVCVFSLYGYSSFLTQSRGWRAREQPETGFFVCLFVFYFCLCDKSVQGVNLPSPSVNKKESSSQLHSWVLEKWWEKWDGWTDGNKGLAFGPHTSLFKCIYLFSLTLFFFCNRAPGCRIAAKLRPHCIITLDVFPPVISSTWRLYCPPWGVATTIRQLAKLQSQRHESQDVALRLFLCRL